MRRDKWRGYDCYVINEIWYYCDDLSETARGHREACGYCGLKDTIEGHDGCIGTLEGVRNACCGHGIAKDAYVQFPDSSDIRGKEALEYIEKEKGRDK